MAGVATELLVAGRRFVEVRRQRRAGLLEGPPDCKRFRQQLQALIERADSSSIAEYHWVEIAANKPPWVTSGIELQAGEQASWFVCGRTYAAKPLDIWVPPAVQIWFRLGDGHVDSATRDSHSIVADRAGALEFGNYFPNDWADRRGKTKEPDRVYRSLKGELIALVIRWKGDAIEGLRELQQAGDVDAWIASEIERVEKGDNSPAGWTSLWNVPRNEIYSASVGPGDQPAICCQTQGDVGILQHDADFPFTPETKLDWNWIVNALPSAIREDAVPSHDYVSIAVEFDNGKDITYYWSACLPKETGYICPLPAWKTKEYHVVVRSGPEELGEWHKESRNLYHDYQQHMQQSMGGEFPKRIVRVWLIANSVFQRGIGDCQYSDIRLSNRESALEVL
ncbi:MAG: DUF3047 domain-containing protein [Oceanococcus sp.]